jgi:ABC-type branched-subunit amino acid transport system substrate-binding protein
MKRYFYLPVLYFLLILATSSFAFLPWFSAKKKIGCLVPLDGDKRTLGLSVLKGLALGIEALNKDTSLSLYVYNTASDPFLACQQLERMIKDGCKVGVALLGEKTAQPVIKKAQALHLPLIVMSPEENVPLGNSVYLDFVTPRVQLENLVNFAMKNLGASSFVILYPQNNYGYQYAFLFAKLVGQNGGKIQKMLGYPPHTTDFGPFIKRIIGFKVAEAKPEVILLHPPRFPFDAVFIPDTPLTSTFIISQFAYYNARNLIFLGTSLWAEKGFARKVKDYCQAIYYPIGFTPQASQLWVESFIKEYKNTFETSPNYLSAQAYEIGRILVYLAKVADLKMEKASSYIQTFPGVTGITTFLPNGKIKKKIWIVESKKGEKTVFLAPAF